MAPESSALPLITVDDLERLSDQGSFRRGQSYYRSKHIYATCRRERTIAGSCHGSSGGPYAVRVTLGEAGRAPIEAWHCTCPLGSFCKHIVALSLTWIAQPDAFAPKASIDELLADRDREGVIAVIKTLLTVVPGLESVFERLVPPPPVVIRPAGPGDSATVSISITRIRQQLNDAIDHFESKSDGIYDDDWYENAWVDDDSMDEIGRINAAFDDVFELGLRHEEAGRIADATALFTAVATIGIDRFDDASESDAVHQSIFAAGCGLIRCLNLQASMSKPDRIAASQRSELSDVIFEIWFFAGHGNWEGELTHQRTRTTSTPAEPIKDASPDVMDSIRRAITPPERDALNRRWRSEADPSNASEWRRRTAIAFGTALLGPGGLSDAEILDLIVRAELWWDQAIHLLEHGRVNDAIAVAARKLLDPNSALEFAQTLLAIQPDGRAQAIRFIEDRLWEVEGKTPAHDLIYRQWLADQYEQSGEAGQALEMQMRLFKTRPDFSRFQQVHRIAHLDGVDTARWTTVRESMLSMLTGMDHRDSMMRIHLAERNARAALDLFNKPPEPSRYSPGTMFLNPGLIGFEIDVANLAERDFPDEAITIHQKAITRLISHKQRPSYQDAIPHLIAVKRILESHERDAEWSAYIKTIRIEHARLRALLDELNRAGL